VGSRNRRILKKWDVKPFGMVIEYANVSKIEEPDQNLECLSIGAC
jgi:hypothetical protein